MYHVIPILQKAYDGHSIYPEHVISTAVGGIRQHLPEDFDWTIYLLPVRV